MHQPFEYQFDWDPVKARLNHRKHGIPFERAAMIFNDPIVVSHTFQLEGEHKAHVRIISARKATRKEIQDYKEV